MKFSCLSRASCRLRDYLIRRAQLRLCLRYVFADACQDLEHRRLLVRRQADQLPAAVYPSFARPVVDLDCLWIDRHRLGGSISVDDGSTFQVDAGSVFGSGIIQLNSVGALTSFDVLNVVTLDGGGKIEMSTTGNNQIVGVSALSQINNENDDIGGGGLIDNLPRILPPNCDAVIETKRWRVPRIFQILQRNGNVDAQEMYQVFNMGIGMVVIIAEQDAQRTKSILQARQIGRIESGSGKVRLKF